MSKTLFPRKVKVESFTTKGVFYEVDTDAGTCTCMAFMRKGDCKHLEFVKTGKKPEPKAKTKFVSIRGYQVDEVSSALQKEIRRGNEENACWWARELLDSDLSWKFWRRVKVISVEDIENSMAIVYVSQLEYQFYKIDPKGDFGKMFALRAVIGLCREPKDRTADDLNCWFHEKIKEGKKKEMPDYAIDMHTRAGRKAGKSLKDFWLEGVTLKNKSPKFDEKYQDFFRKQYDKSL